MMCCTIADCVNRINRRSNAPKFQFTKPQTAYKFSLDYPLINLPNMQLAPYSKVQNSSNIGKITQHYVNKHLCNSKIR